MPVLPVVTIVSERHAVGVFLRPTLRTSLRGLGERARGSRGEHVPVTSEVRMRVNAPTMAVRQR